MSEVGAIRVTPEQDDRVPSNHSRVTPEKDDRVPSTIVDVKWMVSSQAVISFSVRTSNVLRLAF